jgi:hypothetical protein
LALEETSFELPRKLRDPSSSGCSVCELGGHLRILLLEIKLQIFCPKFNSERDLLKLGCWIVGNLDLGQKKKNEKPDSSCVAEKIIIQSYGKYIGIFKKKSREKKIAGFQIAVSKFEHRGGQASKFEF